MARHSPAKVILHSPQSIIGRVLARILLLSLCLGATAVGADEPPDPEQSRRALRDMHELIAPSDQIALDMLHYIQTVAHEGDPALIQTQRKRVLRSVERAILSANQVTPFNADRLLKNAVLEYLNTLYSIVREDYGRIVNLRKVAEQSYDRMEVYLLAKQKANERLHLAAMTLRQTQRAFAEKYNIRLTQNENETSRKLQKATEVMKYYNQIYLINFRAYRHEYRLIDSVNRSDLAAFDERRKSLADIAGRGLEALEAIGAYRGDDSLRIICRKILDFYRQEAEIQLKDIDRYVAKKKEFARAKINFDSLQEKERTRADIERYNEKVKEINGIIRAHRKTNYNLNRNRTRLLKTWNRSLRVFLRRHIPH